MTNEIVQYALKNNELLLNKKEKWSHYYEVLLFFLMIILLSGFLFFNRNDGQSIFYIIVFFISSSLFLGVYRLQKNRLQFQSVSTNLNREEILEIIQQVGNELEWYFEINDNNYILARTYPSFFSGSWGERITIIFGESQVLVNSICDTQKQTSLVSFGRNKKNMNTLIEAIKKAN